MQLPVFHIHVFTAKGCLTSLERKVEMNKLNPLLQIQWSALIFQRANPDLVRPHIYDWQ